jgi:asparagine synthase (glutamine-hydrolysing)
MCGIGGVLRFDSRPADPAQGEALLRGLAHRGPDDAAQWSEGPVLLTHTRLSIIDLAGSRQPMTSADGGSVLAFNGEVLNYPELRQAFDYPFSTDGDTETILAAHACDGRAAPERLRGQFAYALYERGPQRLTLVRDPVGILPLYWYRDDHQLVFASDLQALLATIGTVPEIDRRALASYLAGRSVPAPHTLLRNVRKVRPGHRLEVSANGEITESAYWSPWPRPVEELEPADAVDRLDDLLGRAVRRALLADVPVGSYLSGGVDSSLIAAQVVRATGHTGVHTYCAEFGDERTDESPYARMVADHLGTTHHTVPVRPGDFLDLWGPLSALRGAPLSEPADIAVFRLAEAARRDVKVVLSGEGSDELFAGYPKHRYARVSHLAGLVPTRTRAKLLGRLERALPADGRRLGVALRALSEGTEVDRLQGWFAPFSAPERSALLRTAPRPSAGLAVGASALRRMLVHDLGAWLPDNLLERGDRMSMAASLELRPPFLDHDVVEFALRLPDDLLVRRGTGKWLVKEVARRHLPAEIVDRPKAGFRVPLDAWFRGGLRDYARDLVQAPSSWTATHLDRPTVAALFDSHDSGRRDESVRIFTLASLEVWYAQLQTSPAAASYACTAPA